MSSTSKRCFSVPTKLRCRGASLLEMSISCALMGIIMTCIYALMVAGTRYLNSTNTAIEMQQQSLLAMVWLTHDLGESNHRTISVFPASAGILMGSPRDDAGNTWIDLSGAVRWPKFICYYLDTQNEVPCLMRKEHYMDDPDLHTDPPPLLAPIPFPWQDYDYYKMLEVPPRKVARDVQALTVTGNNPVQLTLKVGKQDWGRQFTVNLQVKVTMRN